MRNPWRGEFKELQEKMEREEYVQKITDHNEEGLIAKHIDCPHYHGHPEGVGWCDENKNRPCQWELEQDCELYQEILKEWEEEK